jgi:drug/metabolite transporter (DMT)-like permease
VLWCVEEPATFASVNYTNELLSSIFILAFFTKAYAYAALMFGQKYTDSMSVAIIASTEPVVTLLIAVLIPAAFGTGEKFSGASFKVMTLIEGLTEVRPVNAIPPVAELCFGWVGGLACGIGNLFADFFGDLNWHSFLGIAANFIAAFLPYRLWHMFSNEAPNLHTKRNIFLYLVISLINAFTTAWLLAFRLDVCFGMWIPTVYIYVFFNNFGFSALFGMPLLIILTSDSVRIQCEKRRRRSWDLFASWSNIGKRKPYH